MASANGGNTAKKRNTTSSRGTGKGSSTKNTRSSSGKSAAGRRNSKGNSNRGRKQVKSAALSEAALYLVFAIGLILFISNFGIAGSVGNFLSALQFGSFGILAYIFPICLFFGVLFMVSNKYNGVARVKFFAAVVAMVFICGLIELISGKYTSIEKLSAYYNFNTIVKTGGGIIGGAMCKLLTPAFGTIGAYIIIIVFIVIAIVIISERSIIRGIKNAGKQVIDSAKVDITQYKEETEKKRIIREERSEERRHERFAQRVSGVDLSIEIPRENINTDILMGPQDGPQIGDSKPAKRKHRPAIADEEVKEVLQNNKYEENIIEITPDVTVEIPIDEVKETIHEVVQISDTYTSEQYDNAGDTQLDFETEVYDAPDYEEDTFYDDEAFARETLRELNSTLDKVEEPKSRSRRTSTETTSSTTTSRAKNSESELTKEQVEAQINEEIMQSEEKAEEVYQFPPIELLKKGKSGNGTSEKELHDTAIKLQQTLANFGVRVSVTNVSCGPAVTRYEIQPEQGVKVSKIVSLADDIKLNLAAADIRIEAPIPGKAAVGIEVPNRETSGVNLRDIIESDAFREAQSPIAFGAGKDIGGQVVVADIAKMPHVLIAGATGSGKSVCINTIIMSILYRANPTDVKLIMIDPKVVELSVYNGIPHLMIPVVTDPKKAAGALNWAVAEMTDRYKKFADYNVRDLKGYNAKVEAIKDIEDENKPVKLPQIVIIVDELADLMMVSKNEVEDAIVRLAQLARAAGIHLVIATQRPSVDVITGLIKANVPSRIAFAVSSGVDSRTIIDMVGAEKLLGKGDMLFSPAGYPKPARVQGAFVSDSEVSAVVDFLSANCSHTGGYSNEVAEQINKSGFAESQAFGGDYDEYFAEAGKFLIEKGKGSIGMLQRVYKIGFNRAARIMDQLEDSGVVGPEEGTKPRKILMSIEEFENLLERL